MKMSSDQIPLKVHQLTKVYGSNRAVNEASFEVRPSEVFGLLGPNGAGKTSIISTIVTLEKPTSGDVEIFGSSVTDQPRKAKAQVGWVPQEVINHGFFNVDEILDFHIGYYGKKMKASEKEDLLKRLGLYQHRFKKVKQLSGGMKRRLMIAKALCHQPKLLLLDEPTAGVDIDLRKGLWEFIVELREQGVAILLTTHYLEEAEKLCDRVGFISHGNILKVGPTKEIIQDLTKKTIHVVMEEEHVTLTAPMSEGVFEIIRKHGIDPSQIKDIKVTEGDLEDAFRLIMKEGGYES